MYSRKNSQLRKQAVGTAHGKPDGHLGVELGGRQAAGSGHGNNPVLGLAVAHAHGGRRRQRHDGLLPLAAAAQQQAPRSCAQGAAGRRLEVLDALHQPLHWPAGGAAAGRGR